MNPPPYPVAIISAIHLLVRSPSEILICHQCARFCALAFIDGTYRMRETLAYKPLTECFPVILIPLPLFIWTLVHNGGLLTGF